MLTNQLRELESDALIRRQVFAEVPPKVEYSLTSVGKTLAPVLQSLCDWGKARIAFENKSVIEDPILFLSEVSGSS